MGLVVQEYLAISESIISVHHRGREQRWVGENVCERVEEIEVDYLLYDGAVMGERPVEHRDHKQAFCNEQPWPIWAWHRSQNRSKRVGKKEGNQAFSSDFQVIENTGDWAPR